MKCATRSALAVFALVFLFSVPGNAQIEFKLHWMKDSLAWGVFARPEAGLNPSGYTIIGSGQVTLVAPLGMQFRNLDSYSGVWEQNAYVHSPEENPDKNYISFGLVSNDPAIELVEGMETLLFTFSAKNDECPDELYLIDNDDPFNHLPNSSNSNPGNDLSVLDPGKNEYYSFSKNYELDAWNCHPGKEKPLGEYLQAKWRRRRLVNRP